MFSIGEVLILIFGPMAFMGIYSVWVDRYASNWSKREIDIFEEAMDRRHRDGDLQSVVEYVREIKKERGIRKDIVDYVLMAEFKYRKWKKR